jgi:hypothetical protein
MVVQVVGNAERAPQRSQHAASSIRLAEGLDAAGFRIQRHACTLRNIVERKYIVPVIIERPEINNIEPLSVFGDSLGVLSRLYRSR